MPKVNTVKKAAKDYPQHGINKGDTYYWWKFRYGGRVVSKSFPKASQLTQSSYLSAVAEIQEMDITVDSLDEVRDRVQELLDECQGNLDNLPEQFQEGHILQERVECCEGVVSELDGVDVEYEEGDEEREQEIIDEIENILGGLE